MIQLHLGAHRARVEAAWSDLRQERVIERILERDHRLWQPDPREIRDRLGWLDSPARMRAELDSLRRIAERARADGFRRVLLLGMGGSSLAPEMMARCFGYAEQGLPFTVLDTTDPRAIAAVEAQLDLSGCLILVASKSGGTVETLSLARYFHGRLRAQQGAASAGRHFVAITDPGSKLEELAGQHGFRTVVHGDPEIGGRFSVYSPFGLLPAALLGLDLEAILDRAEDMARRCHVQPDADLPGDIDDLAAVDDAIRGGKADAATVENPAAVLGCLLGALALAGRDKLTLQLPKALPGLGDWIEQLVAESTGKAGRGILPVVGEDPWPAARYGGDRFFVQLRSGAAEVPVEAGRGGQLRRLEHVGRLADAGHPVLRMDIGGPFDLFGQLYLWEMATAVAAWCLGVNPFDQPDVEAAKRQARNLVDRWRAGGDEPEDQGDPIVGEDGSRAFGDALAGPSPAAVLWRFATEDVEPGDYLAIQVWLAPSPALDAALAALRDAITGATGMGVTVGYGPRFLHSTGQLHKGDAGRGRFVQLRSGAETRLPIPDAFGGEEASIDFALLQRAQAMGDAAALCEAGRRLLTIELAGPSEVAVRRLATWRPELGVTRNA